MRKETRTDQIDFSKIEFDHNASTLKEVLGVEEGQFDKLMMEVKNREIEIVKQLGRGNKLSVRMDAVINSNLPDKVKVLAIFHYGYIEGVLSKR